MKHVYFYDYPVGTIGIGQENGAVCRIFFSGERGLPGFVTAKTSLIEKAAGQLKEYFDGGRRVFDFPLALKGTSFQLSVWKALQTIPYGETRSYKDIAAMIGNPKASRAVGMANNRNPAAIVIPCHRVIGGNGSMTGYAGGISVKKYLLGVEKEYG